MIVPIPIGRDERRLLIKRRGKDGREKREGSQMRIVSSLSC